MPTVSVIIPSYNAENYIEATLGSILGQTFKDIEVLVVDDGSSDRTRDIVSGYGTPVRLIAQQNAGVCTARNHGLREARGRFICFMDHDDYWFPEKLARQIETFETHPEAGVVYSAFILWNAHEDGAFPPPESFDRVATPDDIDPEFSGWIYHLLLLDCWMLTSTAMFRAEVLEKCGSFDESLPFSEDWDLWLRISRDYPMIKLRRPTTLYRQHRRQGNRIVRDIDYRTRLLSQAAKRWGLCSPDGRRVSRRRFNNQLATYHTNFGLNHLRHGSLRTALCSFFKAWLCSPRNLKYLAYIPAALLGWGQK